MIEEEHGQNRRTELRGLKPSSDLLANESGNPTNLAKELPLPDLDSLLGIVNRDCQTLLLKKID